VTGDLGAEHLAGDDSQARVVVLDGSEDGSEGFDAGRWCVSEAHGSGDARAGEAGALGGALECCER
jgi:hypothetical protein